jgi:glycosyltransferase involved in cell wall biosynthesis
MPPFALETFAAALAEGLRFPLRAIRAFASITAPRYRTIAKLKNVALFPKALAVARYVRKNKIEHIHAHWMTTPATVAYAASIVADVPWSCTAHAHDSFAHNLLCQKGSSASSIRVISESNCRWFNVLTDYRFARRSHVVHLGVEVPGANAPFSDSGTLRILAPARLHPIKGHADLIEGLAILKALGVHFHCTLAGDGDLYEQIAAQVQRLGLSRDVTMRGLVEHKVLLAEILAGNYDVVTLTSVIDTTLPEQFEGIPVALMEAMAVGIPCVATATGSIPELITAESGILVPQRDPKALAQALSRLAGQTQMRRQMGLAARERIGRDFNVAKTTRALYELICARPVSAPVSIPAANASCSQGK